MADFLEHFAQLSIAAFDEHDFVPWIVALADLANARRGGADFGRAGRAAVDGDAAAENVELGFRGDASDLDEVGFFNAGGSAGEAVGQLAVVGDEEQAFAHVVEAADRVEALAHLVKKLHDGGAAFGILNGGDKAARLVEHEVAETLGTLQKLAVDADMVTCGVGLGAQLGDNFAVDLDAALLDELLSLAAAGDTGLGEDLLQPVELGWRPRFRGEFGLGIVFRFGTALGFGAGGLGLDFESVFSFQFGLGFVFGGFNFGSGFGAGFGWERSLCFAVGFVANGIEDRGQGF